jgi:hypothetical protein
MPRKRGKKAAEKDPEAEQFANGTPASSDPFVCDEKATA